MKKEATARIKLVEAIAPNISSRDAVRLVGELVRRSRARHVILDFSQIKFLSRSAARELLDAKKRLEQRWLRRKEIQFEHMQSEVEQIITAVSRSKQDQRPRKLDDIREISAEELFLSRQ